MVCNPSNRLYVAALLYLLQDFYRHITGCGALLHHMQEFRCFEHVCAGFVAFRAAFLHRPLILGSIVAIRAGNFNICYWLWRIEPMYLRASLQYWALRIRSVHPPPIKKKASPTDSGEGLSVHYLCMNPLLSRNSFMCSRAG